MLNRRDKALILTLIYLLIVCILGLITLDNISIGVSYAADDSGYDASNIEDDLFGDGSPFDRADFPADDKGDLQFLSIAEVGFSYYSGQQSNYTLYIYVYNPAKLQLSQALGASAVQMAYTYTIDDAGALVAEHYKKYQLRYISKSADNLFFKYKVCDPDKEIYNRVALTDKDSHKRYYDISGIEIVVYGSKDSYKYGKYYSADAKTVEKSVALSLIYSGYAKGYGKDPTAEADITVASGKLTTQQIDVNHTAYRTDSYSDTGYNHYNQLNSVYFGVDRDYIEQYGALYGVKAEWNEQKTKTILVTDNELMYTSIYNTRGIPTSVIGDSADRYQIISSVYSAMWTGWPLTAHYTGNNTAEVRYYPWSYNWDAVRKKLLSLNFVNYKSLYDCPVLYYAFLVDQLDANNIFSRYVSSDSLLQYMQAYRSPDSGSQLLYFGGNTYESCLFEDAVDDGRTRGYNCVEIYNNSDYAYDLLSNKTSLPWYVHTNIRNTSAEEYKGVMPITEIYADDISNLSAELAARRWLVAQQDVDSITQYINAQTAQNKITYLFRFAATDYWSLPVQSAWKDRNDDIAHGYVSKETVFFDFDILELTYCKDGVYKIIPITADPIDIIPAITPPPTLDTVIEASKALKWWEILLIAIACVIALIIIVIIVINLFPYIIKGIAWLITAPFRGIAALAKLIRKKLDARAAQPKEPKPPAQTQPSKQKPPKKATVKKE